MNTLSLHFPLFGNLQARTKTKSKVAVKIIFKAILISQGLLLLCLLGFYVFQIGDLIKLSYTVQTSKQQIKGMATGNLGLEVDSASQSYLVAIEEKLSQLDFVKVENIKYLPIPPNRIAKSR